MGATIYFSNGETLISNTQIRLPGYTFSPADVQSFDVRVKPLGSYRRWELALVWTPLALWVLAFAITIARLPGYFSDFWRGTLTDHSPYANDFIGFLPVLGSLFGLLIYPWLIRKPVALFSVTLRNLVPELSAETIHGAVSASNRTGTMTLGDALSRATGLRPISSTSKYSLANLVDIDWGEPVLYEDAFAKVSTEQVWLAGFVYRVADLERARVTVANNTRARVMMLLYGFILLGFSLFQRIPVLLTERPVVVNGTLLFPQEWLLSLSIVLMALALVLTGVKLYRVSGNRWQLSPTASVVLTGRLGRYDKKVLLTSVPFVTSDIEQANFIVEAIQTAIQHAHHEPTREIRRIPVAF